MSRARPSPITDTRVEEEDAGGTAGLAPPARCGSQLNAVLRKNWLLKKRAWKTTLCELVSPPLFLSILVLGFYLSDVTNIPAGNYASTNLYVGPILDAVAPLTGGTCSDGGTAAANSSSIGSTSGASSLLDGAGDAGCLDLLSLRNSLNSLLNGPLPVLPLSLYLSVGLAVRDSLGTSNFALLNEFDSYLQLFGNILTPGRLHLAPDTPAVRAFAADAQANHPLLGSVGVSVHETEDDAVDNILTAPPGERTWALIAFRNLSARHVDYSIRLNYSTVPNTHQLTRWIARGLDTTYQRYTTSGFLTLQQLVDEYAFRLAAEEGEAVAYEAPSTYVVGTPMPTAAYSQNIFYLAVSYMLSMVLTMCQLFPVALLTKAVVVEKEMRLRQTMRIMGLRDRALYASWWASALLQFFVITVLCTIVIKMFMIHTGWLIIGLYVGLFCLGAISFAFLLSVFFSNGVLAAVVGPVAFVGALLPRYLFFSTNRYERVTAKLYASLLLPTAFAFGADILADFELSEIGISTDNWAQDDFSFLTSLGMMLFDAILYTCDTSHTHQGSSPSTPPPSQPIDPLSPSLSLSLPLSLSLSLTPSSHPRTLPPRAHTTTQGARPLPRAGPPLKVRSKRAAPLLSIPELVAVRPTNPKQRRSCAHGRLTVL
jgi:hypothetical protein